MYIYKYLEVVVVFVLVFLVGFGCCEEMRYESGSVSPKHVGNRNGMFSMVKPPDDEVEYVEKDPTNRYVRV